MHHNLYIAMKCWQNGEYYLHNGFWVMCVAFGTYRGGPSRWDADSHRRGRIPAGDSTKCHQILPLHKKFSLFSLRICPFFVRTRMQRWMMWKWRKLKIKYTCFWPEVPLTSWNTRQRCDSRLSHYLRMCVTLVYSLAFYLWQFMLYTCPLASVSFCAVHPTQPKILGFVAKHPAADMFHCYILQSKKFVSYRNLTILDNLLLSCIFKA